MSILSLLYAIACRLLSCGTALAWESNHYTSQPRGIGNPKATQAIPSLLPALWKSTLGNNSIVGVDREYVTKYI